MGHGKSDRLYVTAAEHSGVYGQHSTSSGKHVTQEGDSYQPLPYDCCAISLQPWSHPVCSKEDGTVFELTNAIPFIKKYSVNPATGSPMSLSDLVTLHFVKNERGRYHDPVSYKEFGEHTHIVAVATSGNVYSWETVQQLNIKAKFMQDLMTDQSFTKKDIITLQDPHNAQPKDVNKLHHVQKKLVVTEADKGIDTTEEVNLAATGSAGSILAKMRAQKVEAARPKEAAAPTPKATEADSLSSRAKAKQPYNSTAASTGMTAASFTSSALTPRTQSERVVMSDEEYMFQQIRSAKSKEKGYVRLSTNFGPLNLELHCDKAPKTCYNFITLCKEGRYDDTVFHRNIPGFMIQGGDPTGTGKGGESIWGQPFRDEFDEPGAFRHTSRGVLSMANRGPSTNGSQFFLTYRAVSHLDSKHTVFGRLVDGEKDSTLSALEQIPTEKGTDRPLRAIRIIDVVVTEDPFERFKEKLDKKLKRDLPEEAAKREEKRRKREEDRTTWLGTELPGASKAKRGDELIKLSSLVGKYVGAAASKPPPSLSSGVEEGRKKKGGGFGDFSGW